MDTVNEKSTSYLTVAFKDKTGAASAPASVLYRIDCLTTGAVIKADSSLSPAASIEITLTATENSMQLTGNVLETRRVTVKATYGAGDTMNEQYDYQIRNLSGVP